MMEQLQFLSTPYATSSSTTGRFFELTHVIDSSSREDLQLETDAC